MMKQHKFLSKIFFCLTFFMVVGVSGQQKQSVIIFSKTEGYRHNSIEDGINSIKKLGRENNFNVFATEDSKILIEELKNNDAVIFLNTTGDILNEQEQKVFIKYINNGGGFVGIHAAADTEYGWPWYGKMVGAYFLSHPKQQDAVINVVNRDHLSTSFLDNQWNKFDEWYNYKDINTSIQVLLNLDENSYEGGKNGKNHPIAWYHEFEGGKIFYTGTGHTKESYLNENFLKHILGGIMYVIN